MPDYPIPENPALTNQDAQGSEAIETPALVAVSERGRALARHVQGRLFEGTPREALNQAWAECEAIVFFGAVGIAVRLLAPLLGDKHRDPAVVVVDDSARHVVSLLSEHEGGANRLARSVAAQLGAEAVISTSSEVLPRKDVVLGIGCSSGAPSEEIEDLARRSLMQAGASFASVAEISTIDAKRTEPGLVSFAQRWNLPIRAYSATELNQVAVPHPSEAVWRAMGTSSVSEAAALLAAAPAGLQPFPDALALPKQKSAHATAAVARKRLPGRLSIIGLGPGNRDLLTGEAWQALRTAEVIVGYTLYVDMVKEWLPLAVCEPMPIGEEVARVRRAITLAREGKLTALVCSGDAGIYGLAGLVYEELHDPSFDIAVIPGITAAVSAAALLGAPLMADFAAISLSDLLTPANMILQRIKAAAESDLVTALYNPASRRRRELLASVKSIFLQWRAPSTPVGLVRNAYRRDQQVRTMELAKLPLDEVDMFTTVVIGNSLTSTESGRMVTRRRIGASDSSE